jgi:hypothetical protein
VITNKHIPNVILSFAIFIWSMYPTTIFQFGFQIVIPFENQAVMFLWIFYFCKRSIKPLLLLAINPPTTFVQPTIFNLNLNLKIPTFFAVFFHFFQHTVNIPKSRLSGFTEFDFCPVLELEYRTIRKPDVMSRFWMVTNLDRFIKKRVIKNTLFMTKRSRLAEIFGPVFE